MKFLTATTALVALSPISLVAALDECCFPVNPFGILELAGACDFMISGDLVNQILPFIPLPDEVRRLEVGDGSEAQVDGPKLIASIPNKKKQRSLAQTPQNHGKDLSLAQTPHEHGRDLLFTLDPVGLIQETLATGCAIPLAYDFTCQSPYGCPTACDGRCPFADEEPFCVDLPQICALLMDTTAVLAIPGYGQASVELTSEACPSEYSDFDCCVQLDYSIDPAFIQWIEQQFPTTIPPVLLPLAKVLDAGLAKLEVTNMGTINLALAHIFYKLCPVLGGDYCCMKGGLCGGDPHFQTWEGEWYDFQGECDLTFIKAPEFNKDLGLDIQIRTKARYDYSFIEGAAVRIGDDILEVFSHGEYFFNRVHEAQMPAIMAEQYSVTHTQKNKKENIFDIKIRENQHIIVSTFKDLVTVKMVNATEQLFGESRGLMGDFKTGAKLGRDGRTVYDDVNEFGFEWQVRDTEDNLFQVERHPQYPQKCILPTPAQAEERRLGANSVSRDEAEAACAHAAGAAKEMCIFDVISTGDLDVAQAGTY